MNKWQCLHLIDIWCSFIIGTLSNPTDVIVYLISSIERQVDLFLLIQFFNRNEVKSLQKAQIEKFKTNSKSSPLQSLTFSVIIEFE